MRPTLFNFEGPKGLRGGTDLHKYGGVAQLGEHLLCKQGVIGSNPFISTSGLKPQTKRVQSEAKAESCIHAEQVKAWEAKEGRTKVNWPCSAANMGS